MTGLIIFFQHLICIKNKIFAGMTNITSHEHILFVLKGGFISESNLNHYILLKCKPHKSATIQISDYAIRIHYLVLFPTFS